MTQLHDTVPRPPANTLGELRASGHVHRSVKDELRTNLVRSLAGDTPRFRTVVGFDDTVLPDLERALLAGHDIVLLGERGQGKTRLLRSLVELLDEWTPVIAGAELHEHPYDPITPGSRARLAELGDDLPVAWVHREDRYSEKLATPDTSIGDLIGDVDPIKVAAGRTLGDPETIHYGLIPRTHRGIMAINELPDLAERIQVGLFNVLSERDIQIRGYNLRLPLDLLVVASANPEDYTNRGRIITPLKDRFGSEIRTHYPLELDQEIALIKQEADLVAEVPEHLLEVLATFTRAVRESPSVDARSGVSARFAIAGAQTVAAAALRRGALLGEPDPVARIGDLTSITAGLRGKVEFETDGEGRELEVLGHLLRISTAQIWRDRLGGVDLTGLVAVATGPQPQEEQEQDEQEGPPVGVIAGEGVSAADLLGQFERVPGLATMLERLGLPDVPSPGQAASAVEFALEGLYLNRRLAKDQLSDGAVVYGQR